MLYFSGNRDLADETAIMADSPVSFPKCAAPSRDGMFGLGVGFAESDVEEWRRNNDGGVRFADSCCSGPSRFQHPNDTMPLSNVDGATRVSSF